MLILSLFVGRIFKNFPVNKFTIPLDGFNIAYYLT